MISFQGDCNNSGVQRFYINDQGNLIVVYTSGLTEDLGHVVGQNGQNFYPNEIGFEIPDGQFRISQPIGWSYLSLANDTSILYFKTSDVDVTPSTWNTVEFGKGPAGEDGKSFKIDSQGTSFPTTGLYDGYTFLNTVSGAVYYYRTSSSSWDGPYQWRGVAGLEGKQGIFKIDSQGTTFPDITNLQIGYTFYKTDTGDLYFVQEDSQGEKIWSNPVPFRGPQGEHGLKGDKGEDGAPGKQIVLVRNTIENIYPNTLLVIGVCPPGFVISEVQVNVKKAFESPVEEMFVRFGGTTQDETTGTVVAGNECFDIGRVEQYIVNDINHEPSDSEEIISCIFDDAVNNSVYGEIEILCLLTPILPQTPIGAYL